MQVNMDKSKNVHRLKIDAMKAAANHNLGGVKSQVGCVIDVSPSMSGLFSAGVIDLIGTRVMALGLQMDDNGTVPVIALNDGARLLKEEMTLQNLEGYIKNKVQPLISGGTNYAPSIHKVLDTIGPGDPAIVFCFTDGDNYDRHEAQAAIVEASRYPIFFMWFGIYTGHRAPSFPFLEAMDTMSGRVIDNCGFAPLSLDQVTDEQLFNAMLKEYPDFLRKAQAQGMLPWNPQNDPRNRRGGQPSGGNTGLGGGLGRLFGRRP